MPTVLECRQVPAVAKFFFHIARGLRLSLLVLPTLMGTMSFQGATYAQDNEEGSDEAAEVSSSWLPSGECDPYGVLVTTTPIPPQQLARLKLYYNQMANLPTDADIVIVGDSQAARFTDAYAQAAFPNKKVLNLGVGGDRTQMTLWRLRHDELGALSPSLVVLLSGGPNLTDSPACAISHGIIAIVERLHAIWPETHILKIDITPRGSDFRSRDSVRTEANLEVRAALKNSPHVTNVNIDDALTCGFYTSPRQTFFLLDWFGWAPKCDNYISDNLHWTEKGYAVVAEAVNANYPPQ